MKPSAVTIAVALTLLAAALASARVGPLADSSSGTPGPRSLAHQRTARVEVGGHLGGLYPGAKRRLRAVVRNDFNRAVRLRAVKVRTAAAGPGCSGANLSLRGRRGIRRMVPAHRSIRVRVRVAMRAGAPDACQGARFPLSFHARVSGRGSGPR